MSSSDPRFDFEGWPAAALLYAGEEGVTLDSGTGGEIHMRIPVCRWWRNRVPCRVKVKKKPADKCAICGLQHLD